MMKQKFWFFVGVIATVACGAFANIPKSGSATDSMAVIPEVSEIRAQRHADLSFDGDLKQLEAKQGRYRENLPLSSKRGGSSDSIRLQRSSTQRKAAPKKAAFKRKPSSHAKLGLKPARRHLRR
jgi:hypothetical protein